MGDAQRIIDRSNELAAISADPDHLVRTYLTAEHKAANALVETWMQEAGLSTWQDAAGNQCGRLEGREPDLPALLLGSHIDTVPDAGRYDGMLGVLLAIEVVGRLRGRAADLPFALEVVAFNDEEGTRFGGALMGSRALAGEWHDDWWDLRDEEGVSVAEAFVDFGLDPARLPGAFRRPEQFVGYLEAHIEQGPWLEDADKALGVVTSIAGARRFELRMVGKAGHAGGSPYDRRRDALVGASELVVEVERISKERRVIGTVGKMEVRPGGVNVIPGEVDFSLDLRAEFDEDRDDALRLIRDAAKEIASRRRLEFHLEEMYRADAVMCDVDLRAAVEAGIRATGDETPMAMWSRAGHDGMAVVAVAPIAMLFIRCKGGVSHHPDESVTKADVAVALDAYEATVLALVGSA